jgi:tetratricopeptide (TPR) repeat protein
LLRERSSDDYYPRISLGYILLAQDRPNDALGQISEAVRLNAEAADARAALGLALLRTSNAEGALTEFEAALSASPGNLELEAGRGAALSALGRHKEALDAFTGVLAADAEYLTRRPDNIYQSYYEASRHSDMV